MLRFGGSNIDGFIIAGYIHKLISGFGDVNPKLETIDIEILQVIAAAGFSP